MLHTASDISSLRHGYQAHRMDIPFPVPAEIGQWLLAHQLFAQGNDFTSDWAKDNPDYKGNSFMKNLWMGVEGRASQDATRLSVYILSKDNHPVGIVAWLRTDTPEGAPRIWIDDVPNNASHYPKQRIPAAILGHLMCYQKRGHRGKGLIKDTINLFMHELSLLAIHAKEEGNMPLVVANDATHNIMNALTHIPLVEEMDVCQKLRRDVWHMWRELRMRQKDSDPRSWFLVEPQPWPKPTRRMR